HAIPSQGHHATNLHALAQLEGCHRAFGTRNDGSLTGDGCQVIHGIIHGFRVLALDDFSHADVDDYLFYARYLHRILITELLLQGRHNLLAVFLFQARYHLTTPRPFLDDFPTLLTETDRAFFLVGSH